MSYEQMFQARIQTTPSVVRALLKLLAGVAVATAFLTLFFNKLLGSFNLPALLGLSAAGIKHWFAWQWLTYVLVLPGPLSLGSILYLLFALYLIWTAGTNLVGRCGVKSFIALVIMCGLGGGLVGWSTLLGLPPAAWLGGAMTIAYGLLVAWTMHVPHQRVLLFMAAPVQMRWITAVLLGFNLLSNLSAEEYAQAAAYGGACVVAYLYSLLVWNLSGPFAFSRRFDQAVAKVGVWWRGWLHRRGSRKGGRIYEFPSDDNKVRRHRLFRQWEASRDDE